MNEIDFSKIKVIASDVDGTLSFNKQAPSPRTVNTIRRLKKSVLFGLASGRPYADMKYKIDDWGMDFGLDFMICWNGCELYDASSNHKYEYRFLKKEWISEIIDFMDEFDVNINMYGKDGTYISSEASDQAWLSAFNTRRRFVLATGKEDFCRYDNGGIMFRASLDDMPKIEKKLELLKGKDYVGFKTQANLLEFSHKDASKGYALKEYCRIHDISLDECLSFGDTTNDNSMFMVSHGICMLNGSDDSKALAQMITEKGVEDEGFVDFIEKRMTDFI